MTTIHSQILGPEQSGSISIMDRGFAYGDGLFETMRVCEGQIPLLDYHLQRLIKGAMVLGLGDTNAIKQAFLAAVKSALSDVDRLETECLIKCILTRGEGGRGYVPPEDASLNLLIKIYPFTYQSAPQSVSVCIADHRLSENPTLAGIKHLNRLDQVMAARELSKRKQKSSEQGFDEILMLSQSGQVIEGSKTNFFYATEEGVFTPPLSTCGIAGTLRQVLLDRQNEFGIEITEAKLSLEELNGVTGAALVNSVMGFSLVSKIEERVVDSDPRLEKMQSWVKQLWGTNE